MKKENVYRLNHVFFEEPKMFSEDGTPIQKEIVRKMSKFRLPRNISEKQAFDILSYLSLRVEAKEGAKINTLKNTMRINALLKEYGFDVVDNDENIIEGNIVELFTIEGKLDAIKDNKKFANATEWFNKNITCNEVANIYTASLTRKLERAR